MELKQFLQTANAETMQDLFEAINNKTVVLTKGEEEILEAIAEDYGYENLMEQSLDDMLTIDNVIITSVENGKIDGTIDFDGEVEWATFRDTLTYGYKDLHDLFITAVENMGADAEIDLTDKQREVYENSKLLGYITVRRDTSDGEKIAIEILKNGNDYYFYAIERDKTTSAGDYRVYYDNELFEKVDAKKAVKILQDLEKAESVKEIANVINEIRENFAYSALQESFYKDKEKVASIKKEILVDTGELQKQIQPSKKSKDVNGPGF